MSEIKNLKKAVQRIKRAVKDNENIVLFSDADLDGAASLIILEEALKSCGNGIKFRCFPDREEEGYGLSKNALALIKKFAPGLLVLADCVPGNPAETEQVRSLGFDLVILDHHEIIEKPAGGILVNPKQPGDDYPFKFFAAGGLCFKMTEFLFKKNTPVGLRESFLELVALATLADKMPETDDNELFIRQGLKTLPFSSRPGLKIFFKKFPLEDFSLKEIVQKIIAVLQISETKEYLTETYRLLGASREDEAEKMLEVLLKKSAERQEAIKALIELFEEQISPDAPFIFLGGEIPFYLTGALSGRISGKHKKPAFVFAEKNGLVRGSVRAENGINTVEALKFCRQHLVVFGGHPPASGFTCKKENLENLKECLKKYFNNQ